VLEAGILALIAFSPVGWALVELQHPVLLQTVSTIYLLAATGLLLASRGTEIRLRRQAALGLCVDLAAASGAMLATHGAETAVAVLLLFNIGAGALILTWQAGIGFATAAAAMLLGEFIYARLFEAQLVRPLAETVMFSVTYLATAILCYLLGKQMSESQELAERRSEELANLAEVNELVIRRMRTGVLVVDSQHRIRVCNEAGWALMGRPSPEQRSLAEIAPALHESLGRWRRGRGEIPKGLVLAEGAPEVLPRFVPLNVAEGLFLIFLDDSRIFSSRAEELTLATLGRLSASIAHEIRNPLSSINYAVQLLEESEQVPDADRRLLEIIHNQCQRMNGIVQNILGLARREASQPESIDLNQFARRFVDDYRASHPLETDVLQAIPKNASVSSLADPRHLHQVVTILVHNALTYGRMPGQPARVALAVEQEGPGRPPQLSVIDRGPGIPPAVAERLFAPFYTTSEHGTGLGLYIARQLCEANQCSLRFVPVPGGGACFTITLPLGGALAGSKVTELTR
ncbi:MAG TPA: HAMP domain-containing sensor histidine kinase, partial [Arenimonas sp.]|nr:HAMP domain-containing sensor histidine kinase [Arenimonas sp.]